MTPNYASPEQVRGESVTTATDIYSLGAVLYHLLTGQRPHRFRNLSLAELERVVCEVESEKPSLAVSGSSDAPARLRRELSGDLDNIIMMSMRKEAERRYQSVEQLSEDIRRHLEGRTVRARQDTVLYRMGKFIRRHKLGVGFATVLLVLLIGFVVMMAVQTKRIARERDRANQVTEFLVNLFEVSDPSEAKGNKVTAREILDKGAEKIDRDIENQPEVQAAMMDTIGRVYYRLGLYDSAMPLVEKSLALKQQTMGKERAEVADSLHILAMIQHSKGNYDNAEALYREALEQRRKLLGEEDIKISESLTDLGELLRAKGDNDGAESLYSEALSLRRKVYGQEHPEVAISLNNLAYLLRNKKDYQAAEPLYREALAIRRKMLGNEHPSVGISLINLGDLLHNMGHSQAAEPMLKEAVSIFEKALGQNHWLFANGKSLYGACLTKLGRYSEAEAQLLEAHTGLKSSMGEKHERTKTVIGRLIELYEAWGQPAKATQYRELLKRL